MGDGADRARQSALAQSRQHAAIAGAEAVNADNVAMAIEDGPERGLGDGGVVMTFDRRQRVQMRILGAQDLLEAKAALGVVAQQHRAGDDGDASIDAAQEAPHQRPGGAARGAVVDADILHAPRARRVGNQRHDANAARYEAADGEPHRRMVGRHQRDAGQRLVAQAIERFDQRVAVERRHFDDRKEHALAAQRVGELAHLERQ